MEFKLSFDINEAIYLRDPESSELGKKIIEKSIELIYNIGFETFTFKKLALEIGTTEASVYRYFENKYKLLLYITNWYWFYLIFTIDFQLQNIQNDTEKIKIIVKILTHKLFDNANGAGYNKNQLYQIVINESIKLFLIKDVDDLNRTQLFKPYKDLCAKIGKIFSSYNPTYLYPNSLSSTLIETVHAQQFFQEHLPRLTDSTQDNKEKFLDNFVLHLVFSALEK